ncbi:Uncharacterised protein [Mycobacterium tuberculosis]|uniref:Transmembrane protein n=1 Tax=Mycobacterium tuberculosis TaxID=1773 RepID=A0A654ZCJ2_MYCTX|nr:Uncharacterised protein [Mycobacterium tuberculosis]CKQ59061.1 Uncharacterised protein [Mycobacterium tuberculosis]CKR75698.1 Uncharacterised protein [Mycobacterium tuberculosis]CKR99849.1 Uncharacterised protein [Mycobacterium tuberculosis]CKS16737.1 Uncharacterised protein [Mycobacterium tuberculosis]
MLVGRRIAPLPLVGVASTLVLVPALVGVAALLGVTALVGVPDLLGVVALVRVARAWVARLGRVAARLGWIPPAGVRSALRIRATTRILLRTRIAVVVILVGTPLPLTATVARIVTHWCYSWFCAKRVV